jgi:hypothetical protein
MNQARSQKVESRVERRDSRRQGPLSPPEWLLAAAAVTLLGVFSSVFADTFPVPSSDGLDGGNQQLFDAIAMGPVEQVTDQPSGLEISVLGQTFLASTSEDLPSVGDYVIAAGRNGVLSLLLPNQ